MAELKITAANFENEVLHSDKPVLLDFYADWCGPCKMLSPVLHELAEEKSGTLKVGKVNVDEQMDGYTGANTGNNENYKGMKIYVYTRIPSGFFVSAERIDITTKLRFFSEKRKDQSYNNRYYRNKRNTYNRF